MNSACFAAVAAYMVLERGMPTGQFGAASNLRKIFAT